MVKLYGSFNSRFFACLTPQEIRLYRGIAAGGSDANPNQAQLLFARAIDESLGVKLIRVGNQGALFFEGPKGLYRLCNNPRAELEMAHERLPRGAERGKTGRVVVDASGCEVYYETISPVAGIKNRFGKLLGGKSDCDSSVAHQLVCLNLRDRGQRRFPPARVDTRSGYGFYWSISPSGRFLVQAYPVNRSYHLDIIDVTAECIVADFQMPLANIHRLWVNDSGVMMVHLGHVGDETLILALPDGATRHSFRPPVGCQVLHLGVQHVACLVEMQSRLQVFDYPGNLISEANLQPLRDRGVVVHLGFNDRDQIDVLHWESNTLYLHYADIRSIEVDARRWQLQALQQSRAIPSRCTTPDITAAGPSKSATAPLLPTILPQQRCSPALGIQLPTRPGPARPPCLRDGRPQSSAQTKRGQSISFPRPGPLSSKACGKASLFSSLVELDAELQRVQMIYVAGEFSREEYRSRRHELESLRRSMDTPTGPS
ncbi:hypothetical protein IV102_13915 [bacterium]|nr:hypothetical protein [bacterium]